MHSDRNEDLGSSAGVSALDPFTFIQRLFDPSPVESLRGIPSSLECAVSGSARNPRSCRDRSSSHRGSGAGGVVPGESIGHGFKSRPPYKKLLLTSDSAIMTRRGSGWHIGSLQRLRMCSNNASTTLGSTETSTSLAARAMREWSQAARISRREFALIEIYEGRAQPNASWGAHAPSRLSAGIDGRDGPS